MIDLTTGEKLQILRRRRNMTQTQVAGKYLVSQITVSMWETDAVPFPGLVNDIHDLHAGEECYILRRRLKLFVADVAAALGVSHVTLLKWEKKGPPDTRYKDYLLRKMAKLEIREMA